MNGAGALCHEAAHHKFSGWKHVYYEVQQRGGWNFQGESTKDSGSRLHCHLLWSFGGFAASSCWFAQKGAICLAVTCSIQRLTLNRNRGRSQLETQLSTAQREASSAGRYMTSTAADLPNLCIQSPQTCSVACEKLQRRGSG